MDLFSAMDILASGLNAERVRMNVTASNLANAKTTRTPEGGPYKRRDPVFQPVSFDQDSAALDAPEGVDVTSVVTSNQPPKKIYQPGHPDADPEGYVAVPNIEMVEEMVNMMTASRSYEAGVTALKTVVQMAQRALTLGR